MMGIPGSFTAVTVPKWLIGVVSFVGGLLLAGWVGGMAYGRAAAAMETQVLTNGAAHSSIFGRLDTLDARVHLLSVGRVGDSELLRSLVTLRCIDGTPRNLTNAAQLPCAALTAPAATQQMAP